MDALGGGMDDEGAAPGFHDHGVVAPPARHQAGVGGHGGDDAAGGGGARRCQALGRRQTRHGAGDGGERHGDGGDSASVGSHGRGGEVAPGHVGQGLGDAALHGVAGLYVAPPSPRPGAGP